MNFFFKRLKITNEIKNTKASGSTKNPFIKPSKGKVTWGVKIVNDV